MDARLNVSVRNSMLVGARGFEPRTPCAQGSEIGSMRSIGFREFLMVTTIRGICFRSTSKVVGWNGSGSDTVLAQRESRGAMAVLRIKLWLHYGRVQQQRRPAPTSIAVGVFAPRLNDVFSE